MTRLVQNVGWGMTWIWSDVYRGIEVRCGHRSYFIGHVPREWKRRGW